MQPTNIILILVSVLLMACEPKPATPQSIEESARIAKDAADAVARNTKKIIMKESPVEQRAGFDFWANEPFRQKSVTIYYLIAEDGAVTEVGLSDFAKTQIGSTFYSPNWTTK